MHGSMGGSWRRSQLQQSKVAALGKPRDLSPMSPTVDHLASSLPDQRPGSGPSRPLQFPRQASDRSKSPTPEGPSPPAPKSQAASMAFAKSRQARRPHFPNHRRNPLQRCRLRVILRTGQSLGPASTPASRSGPGGSTTGDLGVSPDGFLTGWLTRACPLGYATTTPLRSSVRPSCWTHVDRT
jgi:hypothetical protein